MSYRFVMRNGELKAVPVERIQEPPEQGRRYDVGTKILFPRFFESSQTIAVAVA